MKSCLPLLLACLLGACASGPVVQTEHDPVGDFANYHTYAWRQPPPISDPVLRQKIVDAVDAELRARSWRLVDEAHADVVLVGNVSARDEQTVAAFYDGPAWNGWGWRQDMVAGVDPRRVEIHTYKVGSLVLDMFEVRSRRAVWRAVAEGTVPTSLARRESDAMKAVHAMFVRFPD